MRDIYLGSNVYIWFSVNNLIPLVFRRMEFHYILNKKKTKKKNEMKKQPERLSTKFLLIELEENLIIITHTRGHPPLSWGPSSLLTQIAPLPWSILILKTDVDVSWLFRCIFWQNKRQKQQGNLETGTKRK